jgi:uncharacterized protein YcbK (DUF882 family)
MTMAAATRWATTRAIDVAAFDSPKTGGARDRAVNPGAIRRNSPEEGNTVAEKDRNNMEVDLVQQRGLKILLRDIRAAHDQNLAACRKLCLPECGLDPFSHERVRGATPGNPPRE